MYIFAMFCPTKHTRVIERLLKLVDMLSVLQEQESETKTSTEKPIKDTTCHWPWLQLRNTTAMTSLDQKWRQKKEKNPMDSESVRCNVGYPTANTILSHRLMIFPL